MQFKFKTGFILTLSIGAFLATAVGCTEPLAFKVVDAKTLQPIAGAETIVDSENMAYSGYVDIVRRGGGTSKDGRIILGDIRSDGLWRTSVLFSRVGYYEAGFRIERGGRSTVMLAPKKLFGDSEIDCKAEADDTGAVLIKMYPSVGGDEDTEFHKWTNDPHLNK